MDIWHRVGRIVRFSNLGTLLFFTLNILLIVAVFGSSGSIVELICIYFFTVAISLSPLGEMCLAAFAGASDIKRVDIKLRVVPLVQYVLDKAKENTSYCPKKVKVKIIHDPAPNAFALGRQTLCITDGLLLLSDDMILGILAHEIGHLSYGHTVIQLLIRFLYKGIIIKHNKTEPTYTKTSLFLCEKRRFFMGRTEKGGKVF